MDRFHYLFVVGGAAIIFLFCIFVGGVVGFVVVFWFTGFVVGFWFVGFWFVGFWFVGFWFVGFVVLNNTWA